MEINSQGNKNSLHATSSRIDYIAGDLDFDQSIERNITIKYNIAIQYCDINLHHFFFSRLDCK